LPQPPSTSPDKPYLTYKLDLLKTIATRAADPYYLEAANLRVRELRVLRLIHAFPGIVPGVLRHKVELDKTLLAKNLALLEGRGLIARTPDPRDNRLQRLSLTEEGTRVWMLCEQIGRKLVGEMFADIGEADMTALDILLDRLLVSIDRWRKEHAGETESRLR
jgi:DNA-binding MarR family transcriptional regulator